MYASINNIKSKTDRELEELRDLRINDLWIGTETGLEENEFVLIVLVGGLLESCGRKLHERIKINAIKTENIR